MPDHSFSKEIFPHIQSESPLTQLEAIATHPILLVAWEKDLGPK